MAKASKDYDSAPEADVLEQPAAAPAPAIAPAAQHDMDDLVAVLKHAQLHAGPITNWMIAAAEEHAAEVPPEK